MNHSKTGTWLTTSRAARALDIHPVTLRRKRNDGYLIEGVHFIKMGDAKNSQCIWNVEKILDVFTLWKAPSNHLGGDE